MAEEPRRLQPLKPHPKTHHDLVAAVLQVAHRAEDVAAEGVQLPVRQDDGAGAAGVVDCVVLELLPTRVRVQEYRVMWGMHAVRQRVSVSQAQRMSSLSHT